MLGVVLDTNVVLSAILFGGKPRQVLEAAIAGLVQLHVSEEMICELEGVLRRPKLGLDPRIVQSILAEMASMSHWVEPQKRHRIIKDDPDDDRVIDCAVAARADYIVSGDRHLLQLAEYEGIPIIAPAGLLEVLNMPRS